MRPGFLGNLGDMWFGELGRHGRGRGRSRGHHKEHRRDHPVHAEHPGKHKGWKKDRKHPGKHKGWKKDDRRESPEWHKRRRRKGWKRWKKRHKEAYKLMKEQGPCAALKGRQQARCMKQLWRAYKEAKVQAAKPAPGPLSGFFGFFGL